MVDRDSSVVLDTQPRALPSGTSLVRRSLGRSALVEVSEDVSAILSEIGVRLSDVLSAEYLVCSKAKPT